jgi:large subunit ribosomal protein L18
MATPTKNEKRLRLKRKIRSTISGTAVKPRLSVYRSNAYIYAQLIDDVSQTTLCSASDVTMKTGTKMERAVKVGQDIVSKAKAKNIDTVVFDRNGFKYSGRIKTLADSARAATELKKQQLPKE